MAEQNLEGADARGLDRRHLLMAGGAAAAVVAAGATVLGASPASAAPLVPVLLPVAPMRIYDSREPDALGPISDGFTDTLTYPPNAALAYLMNVTVVDTQGFGWVTVFSADLASVETSTLNWYGPGQTMVNTAYTFLRAADAGIKVSCGGGGQANYVLDVTAALVMYDAGAAPTSIAAVAESGMSSRYTAVRS